jgi:hypothetical protein
MEFIVGMYFCDDLPRAFLREVTQENCKQGTPEGEALLQYGRFQTGFAAPEWTRIPAECTAPHGARLLRSLGDGTTLHSGRFPLLL